MSLLVQFTQYSSLLSNVIMTSENTQMTLNTDAIVERLILTKARLQLRVSKQIQVLLTNKT